MLFSTPVTSQVELLQLRGCSCVQKWRRLANQMLTSSEDLKSDYVGLWGLKVPTMETRDPRVRRTFRTFARSHGDIHDLEVVPAWLACFYLYNRRNKSQDLTLTRRTGSENTAWLRAKAG
jgi:hypothetical protein